MCLPVPSDQFELRLMTFFFKDFAALHHESTPTLSSELMWDDHTFTARLMKMTPRRFLPCARFRHEDQCLTTESQQLQTRPVRTRVSSELHFTVCLWMSALKRQLSQVKVLVESSQDWVQHSRKYETLLICFILLYSEEWRWQHRAAGACFWCLSLG